MRGFHHHLCFVFKKITGAEVRMLEPGTTELRCKSPVSEVRTPARRKMENV